MQQRNHAKKFPLNLIPFRGGLHPLKHFIGHEHQVHGKAKIGWRIKLEESRSLAISDKAELSQERPPLLSTASLNQKVEVLGGSDKAMSHDSVAPIMRKGKPDSFASTPMVCSSLIPGELERLLVDALVRRRNKAFKQRMRLVR